MQYRIDAPYQTLRVATTKDYVLCKVPALPPARVPLISKHTVRAVATRTVQYEYSTSRLMHAHALRARDYE